MVTVELSKEDVNERAIQFMASNDYKLISRSDNMLSFEDGKDMKTWLLVLGILFLLIGAIIYYLMSKRHSITITISETSDGTKVTSTTNTQKSMLIANEFINTL